MTTIRVTYHHEDGAWWADSSDLDGWYAGGETLAEARAQVREGLAFYVDGDLDLFESDVHGQPVVVSKISGLPSAWFAGQTESAQVTQSFHGVPSAYAKG